jgi:hypothetical protein
MARLGVPSGQVLRGASIRGASSPRPFSSVCKVPLNQNMKNIKWVGAGLVMLAVGATKTLLGQETATAQNTFSSVNVSLDSATDVQTMLAAIESVPPIPFDATARQQRFGTFWSAQHPEGTRAAWPPLPGNILGLPVWPLGDGQFIVDDRDVDYDALAEAAAQAEAVTTSGGGSMMMMAMNLASSYAYGHPVYLTNLAAISSGYGNMTASFGIGGGTNFVPYDMLMSTNVAAPVASWNWLGIGYTSNRYTFTNQPANLAFYILAKPSKTMVVAWGNNSSNQCDVPLDLTNALMVAGGFAYSLALLNDGTIVGWGTNSDDGWVPTGLVGVAMVTAGWNHNVALLTNGTVIAWGANSPSENQTNVPADLTNATVISAQALNTMALRSNGRVIAWGDNYYGETNVPVGLSNVVAIAQGGEHCLAVSNGFVVAWGWNGYGQCTVPAGLSNVWDVAAGWNHSVALKKDGTVVCWGDNSYGERSVPAGLSNVVAIAAGGDPFSGEGSAYTLALKSDGTVKAWGYGEVVNPLGGLNHVIAISGGDNYGLAVRTGPRTPVITLEPVDQYQVAGSNVTFMAKGQGLYGVTYQWQTNGVNLSGATLAALTLTNVGSAQQGIYNVVVTGNGGTGSIVSSNASLYLVTPPVITYQSQPTNVVCIYGNHVAFAVTATAPGQFNRFPLTYRWQFNGTNISSATNNAYDFYATDNSSGIYSLSVSNAAGGTNVSWQVTVTNAINVTNDLLLIYNTNSAASTTVLNYYLAHRPMVGGANVLGIGCTNLETFLPDEYTNVFAAQVQTWLAANPTKRPQYVVLFPDIPSRVNETNGVGVYPWQIYSPFVLSQHQWPSVQYQLATGCLAGWNPFVTSINMNGYGGTNDCIAYINKLQYIGTNYSPGKLVISASARGYGNTNYVLDGIRFGDTNGCAENFLFNGDVVSTATNGLLSVGVLTNNILFFDGVEFCTNGVLKALQHPTGITNVAGYITWGQHCSLGGDYPFSGSVAWRGNSSWWIMESIESFNGERYSTGQGIWLKWFSASAFGGTNYSNTPVGGVTHVDEPGLSGVNTSSTYFGLWAAGKNLAICAWNSRNTPYLQVVGDPFITR